MLVTLDVIVFMLFVRPDFGAHVLALVNSKLLGSNIVHDFNILKWIHGQAFALIPTTHLQRRTGYASVGQTPDAGYPTIIQCSWLLIVFGK